MKRETTAMEQVVQTILSGIEKGTFKVGQKIPSQRKLSELLGVSRMVVREAIKLLEGRGILISKRGSGIYVQQTVAESENLSLCSLSSYALNDIYSLSNVIWESCTDLVIQNSTDEEIKELFFRVQEMLDNYSSTTTLQTKYLYESSFGMTICKLTHNKLLYKLMVELLNITASRDYEVVKSNNNYKKIVEIDFCLVEALLQRDLYRARFWSRERDLEIEKLVGQKEISIE